MKILYFLAIIFTFQLCKAQDIKPLDYASLYHKHKVKSRECYEIRYKGNNSSDSIHIGSETFNQLGQLIAYTEYYAKGQKMAEYKYEYDNKNKLIRNTVSLVFNNWQEMEFKLTFDAKGKLVKRELLEAVPSFWSSEMYHYNTAGILVKSEQFYLIDGAQKSMAHKDYPPNLQPRENSLSYIYDPKGLLILHQIYHNGKVNKAYKFDYSYF